MTGRLPDLIIAGAPRSGTTYLSAALDAHPRIWMAKPAPPEPKFFLVDESYAEGLAAYSERWFAGAPDGVLLGEKSTNYLESPVAAERIAHDLPDVRLLFMLRDPVARAVSNYRWSVMHGFEDQDLATALALEDEREARLDPVLRYSRPHAYFSRGCYARLLRPWFRLFPGDQVLVLRFEDLVADPDAVLERAQTFLGVPARGGLMPPLGATGAVNASRVDAAVDPQAVEQLRRAYEQPNRELADLLGPHFQVWGSEVHVP